MPFIIILQTADSKIVDRISIALSQLISILIRIVKWSTRICRWVTGHAVDEKTFALARSYVFADCWLDTDLAILTQATLIRTGSEPNWINGLDTKSEMASWYCRGRISLERMDPAVRFFMCGWTDRLTDIVSMRCALSPKTSMTLRMNLGCFSTSLLPGKVE